eukprot:sb/3465470/
MPAKMVYWIDGYQDVIMSVGYEGGWPVEQKQIPGSTGFSLEVYNRTFYWSDWQNLGIMKIGMDDSDRTATVVTPDVNGATMELKIVTGSFNWGVTNECSAQPCDQICFADTSTIDPGYVCGCQDGQLAASLTTCAKSKCLTNNGGCLSDQTCKTTATGDVVCSCPDFFELIDGACKGMMSFGNELKQVCEYLSPVPTTPMRLNPVPPSPESYLLLASQYSIWKLSILGDGIHEKVNLAFGGKVIAIDFDYEQGRVFWTDPLVDAISMGSLSGTDNTTTIVLDKGLLTPDGLAYDWVSDVLYWTCMGTFTMGVVKPDGSHSRIIKEFDENSKPRALVLDPVRGVLFYSDWGEQSAGIYKCWGDGSNCEALATEEVHWPNGLTMDRDAQVNYSPP